MQKTLGLVLKKQNIGETDRIITIFSPSLGKKRVVARAVRKTTSRLAGHLDTFMVTQLILTDAPDLPKITSAVLVEPFEGLRSSLVNLERAFAISKIVERVILEDVNQQSIFQLTLDGLMRLNEDQPWPNVWLYFLGSLTHQLGLALSDYRCYKCNELIRSAARFLPQERRFICPSCVINEPTIALDFNSVKLLRLLQNKTYTVIEQIRFNPAVGTQVEEVLLREVTEWFNKPWSNYANLGQSEGSFE